MAGNYRIAAVAAGFRESIRSGIRLSVGGRVEVDFPLELGAVSESITVDAQAPLQLQRHPRSLQHGRRQRASPRPRAKAMRRWSRA